jgi:hypothetical protein
MASLLYAIPAMRLGGAVASGLICMHALAFLKPQVSWLRFIHNLADIVIFSAFGVSGIVAELFPRDSATYRLLKANFPLVLNLIGRGIFYIVLGCLVMGDYGSNPIGLLLSEEEDYSGFVTYFTIFSGLYISLNGAVQLYWALKSRSARSLQTAELSQPIVAFVPSVIERAPEPTLSPDETPV